MSQLRKSLGDRVRKLRKSQGLTQEGLASKSGLHSTYLGAIERGEKNVSVDNIEKIAKGLGVEPADLFRLQTNLNRAALNKKLDKILQNQSPEVILKLVQLLEATSE